MHAAPYAVHVAAYAVHVAAYAVHAAGLCCACGGLCCACGALCCTCGRLMLCMWRLTSSGISLIPCRGFVDTTFLSLAHIRKSIRHNRFSRQQCGASLILLLSMANPHRPMQEIS